MEQIPEHPVMSSDQEGWSVTTRLVVWLLGWCCAVLRKTTKSPWTKCCPEKRWWSSALIAKFWSENDCAACCLASWTMRRNTFRPWTRPRQRFRHAQEIVTGDTVGDPLNGLILSLLCTVWSSLRSSALCLDQPCCASNFECGLRVFFSFQWLVSSVWSWLNQVDSGPHFEFYG